MGVAKAIAKSSPIAPVVWHHSRFFHDHFGRFRRASVGFVGVGVAGGYTYPYGCDPYYQCCYPYSYPLNYPYSQCPPYYYGYGGPAVAFGFNNFAFDNDVFFARRFHNRHFFDGRRFVGFDRRFTHQGGFGPRVMGGSMSHPFAMGGGMGHPFVMGGGMSHPFVHARGFGGGWDMAALSWEADNEFANEFARRS